jgi:tetratricopeptide (TPR) repeat protein
VAVIVAALAVRTVARNADWRSDLTLGESAVQTAPDSYKSHKLLANALFESHVPIDRVLAEADKSLAILSPLPDLRNNADSWRRAANWYLAKGDSASAHRSIEILQRCMAIVTAQDEQARSLPRYDPATSPLATARADVNRTIAAAYLKLGDPTQALAASAGAIELDPENPDAYRQYAQTLSAAGRNQEAMVTLMEGVMLTVDPGLRQLVVELYQRGLDPHGCALLAGQDGRPALNPSCDTVRGHLCAATVEAIKLRKKTGREDRVEQLRASGVRDFGCPASQLDQAMK